MNNIQEKHRAFYQGFDAEGRQLFVCTFCSYRVHLPIRKEQLLFIEQDGVDGNINHYGAIGGLEIAGIGVIT